MSVTIRLTINPGVEIVVSDQEYINLRTLGLVVGQATPAPADPNDVEIADFFEDETSLAYQALRAASVALISENAPANIAPFTARQIMWASRVTAPVDVLGLGDSLFSGQTISTIGARWPNRTMTALRERFRTPEADPGGLGYIPAFFNHTAPTTNPWVATGNTSNQATFGLGQAGKTLGADSGGGVGTITGTFSDCTSIQIVGYDGTVNITVDGGTAVTGIGTTGRWTWSTGPLTRGQHTIVVARNTLTPRFLGGVIYCKDENSGIRYWDGAKSGTRADQFTLADGGTELWADNIGTVINPDLILVEWMTNDFTNRTVAQYQTALTNLRTVIRGKTAAPILWVAPYERIATGFGGATWSQYVAAMRAVADADTGDSDFVNMGDYVPRLSPDTYGALSDGTHPSDKLAAHLGEVLGDYLLNVWSRAS